MEGKKDKLTVFRIGFRFGELFKIDEDVICTVETNA